MGKIRPCPNYLLVEWSQLDTGEQNILSGLSDEAEVYGMFQPAIQSANFTQKVAYKEAALLYLHLQHTNILPHYIYSTDEQKLTDSIVQMILNGILEIEYQGNFVSGTAAINAIFGETLSGTPVIPNYLSQLSMEAIQYGLQLRNMDVRSLSYRLYTFNTIPWAGYTRSKFNNASSVKEYLFSAASKEINNLLHEYWRTNELSEQKYWLSWSRIATEKDDAIKADQSTFKLYISPAIHDMPHVFERTIHILSASQTLSFKTGNTIHGLLRPDKMVAYFESHAALKETAAILEKEFTDFVPQGVAFTGQLDEKGILSWGVDPPQAEVLSTVEAGSWRLEVTDQLALAIIQAQSDHLDLRDSIRFIKAKLLSLGINAEDWTVVDHAKEF